MFASHLLTTFTSSLLGKKMTTTIPPLTDLCPRCRVLEFDDSTWPGAYKAGSETEGYYLEITDVSSSDPASTRDRLDLDYELVDSLPGLPLLSEAAQNGCGFCSVLNQAIQRYARAHSQGVVVNLSYAWNSLGTLVTDSRPTGLMSLAAEVGWIRYGQIEEISCLGFHIDAPLGSCSRWLRLEAPPRDDALCPENILMVVDSLKKSSYTLTYVEGNVYPARLIEAGELGAVSCRLVETHSHPEFAGPSLIPYAALSYCWGPQEDAALQFKTERCSLEDRLSGFQVDQVTPILRDAIQITRALGIPYLWVDAVCIVQDDDEDWDRESSRMILVYRNAVLTISTPASASCQQGVLARDWTMTSIKFQSKIDRTVSGSYILRLISEEPALRYTSCDCLTFSLQFTRWAFRGWALQEYELSRRTLVFGRTKLHILTDNAAQSEGSGLMNSSIYTGRVVHQLPIWKRQWYLYWLTMVDRYSERKLSDPSDKLPAISGLARYILPKPLPNYYTGHIFLHIDLFWVRGKSPRPYFYTTKEALVRSLQFQDPYVAPSWSWASRSHKVHFGDWSFFQMARHDMSWHNVTEECEFIKASVSLAGSDLFGKVRDGSLLLRGAVVPVPPNVRFLGEVFNGKRWQATENDKYISYLNFDWDEFEGDESFEELSLVLLGSCKTRENMPWTPVDGTCEVEQDYELQRNSTMDEDVSNRQLEDKAARPSTDTIQSTCFPGGYARHDHASVTEKELAHKVSEGGEAAEGDDQNHSESKLDTEEKASNEADLSDTPGPREYVYPLIEAAEPRGGAKTIVVHPMTTAERNAYGLIIHPASAPGKYLRVGVFYSVPVEHGGMKYFQNRPIQTVEII
ncbi:HET-domain-containing protein [Hypoxylon cercidicola]|nr:HET-domain-containing protein [Hypoxylon cercidicola]